MDRRAFGEFASHRGELASYAVGWVSGGDERVGRLTIGMGAGNPGGGTFHMAVGVGEDGRYGLRLVDEPFEDVPEGGPDMTREDALAHDDLPWIWAASDRIMRLDRRALWMLHWVLETLTYISAPVFAHGRARAPRRPRGRARPLGDDRRVRRGGRRADPPPAPRGRRGPDAARRARPAAGRGGVRERGGRRVAAPAAVVLPPTGTARARTRRGGGRCSAAASRPPAPARRQERRQRGAERRRAARRRARRRSRPARRGRRRCRAERPASRSVQSVAATARATTSQNGSNR